MRDFEKISDNRKIRIKNIDPVFCEGICEKYKKEENYFFHFFKS